MGFSIGGLTGSNSSAKKAATVAYERQKEILQNQHQWEMKDLEKAGLNPALTLGDIGGSSGGSVSPAQVNAGGDSVMGLINSAVSAYTAKKNAETGETQGQLNLANAGKAIAETEGIPQQIKNDTIKALASQTQANAEMKQAQIAEALAPEQKKKAEAETENTKEQTKRTKGGAGTYLFGTDEKHPWKKAIAYGSIIPGLGMVYKGYKGLKAINSAKNFGKGLWR